MRSCIRAAAVCLAFLAAGLDVHAGKAVLKSGFEIPGTPVKVPGLNQHNAAANLGQNVPQTPYWMVDDGIRRYFIHRQNLKPDDQGIDGSDDSSKYPRFTLQPLLSRRDAIPTWVGGFAEKTPWDEHGRCRVTLVTPQGPDPVQLAITELDPRYLTITSTSHLWDFGLHVSLVPSDQLRAILQSAIDSKNPDQRMAVVMFFLYADGQLHNALAEVKQIREDFPELAARADELQQLVMEQYGNIALKEVLQRREIGQHGTARFLAHRILQEDLRGDTLREAQAVLDGYAHLEQQAAEALMLLSTLQGELAPDDAARVAPLRASIERELNEDSLPRLEPFLRNAADANLPAGEKLALALSGWLLGPAYADTSLSRAVSLWDARFLVLDYLRPETDFGDRRLIQDKLTKLEGVSVETIARMVPQLPSSIEFSGALNAQPQIFDAPPSLDSQTAVRYGVLTPPEYHPSRSYPAVVVLRPEGRTIEDALAMWGGNAARPGIALKRGYIVIAPDYVPAAAGDYNYGREAHDIVLRALFDARQRLNIDSDRVFLAGSGIGGDAAFDIGLSHSDLWAGVIPSTGLFQHAAWLNRGNAPQLPFYVIGGERDRNSLDLNASAIASRMQRGWDLIYCEYKQRGHEPYLEELPRVFDWMALQQRPRVVKEIKHTFCRDFENRDGWLKWVDPPAAASQPILWGEDNPGKRSFTVEAKIPQEQYVHVGPQPSKHTVLWLSPELVDYESPIKVVVGSATKFRGLLQPDMTVLLDDLRDRGDRQRLYWTRLEF